MAVVFHPFLFNGAAQMSTESQLVAFKGKEVSNLFP
jgi:hypothetical protein